MSGGETSYGFEYQIYASVLLMLIEHQISNFVGFQIETDFGNDAEAIVERLETLKSGDLKILDLVVDSRNSSKQIQIKTKTPASLWQPNELREILLKKDESRSVEENKDLLEFLRENEDQIFIFVTNGRVDRKLSGLLANINTLERLLQNSSYQDIKEAILNSVRRDESLSKILETRLENEIFDRIYIIEGLSLEDIELRVSKLLIEKYGIPSHKTSDLTRKLVDLVRSCMLRQEGRNCITADDLEAIIGKPGTKVPYPQWEDSFVTIPYYKIALECLEKEHIVILLGEPAVGKTTTAQKLTNFYCKHGYECKFAVQVDAPSAIMRAIINSENAVFLLDDFFGFELFDPQSEALGNQFANIVQQLKIANGRVKVIITSRVNVLAEARTRTRIGTRKIEDYTVSLPYPDERLMKNVLSTNLRTVDESIRESILTSVNFLDFENLLHISQFSEECVKLNLDQPQSLQELITRTKPSAYNLWIREQPSAVRLMLYSLWAVVRTNQFVWESDLRQTFNLASNCIEHSNYSEFGSLFDQILAKLRDSQNRIIVMPNGAIDFIHPKFRKAVEDFLEKEQVGSLEFMNCFFEHLAKSDYPLPQSIAVMLALTCGGQLNISQQLLRDLYMSRYIRTLETIIRFGGGTLVTSLNLDAKGSSEYRFLFRPEQCEIDENGFLVLKQDFDLGYSFDDLFEYESWRLGIVEESELLEGIEIALRELKISRFNELDRIKFGYWLIRNWKIEPITKEGYYQFLTEFATDPVSFVREVAANALSDPDVLAISKFQEIFEVLCYDHHPHVKIAMLEEVILPNWRFQDKQRQEIWFNIVKDMLRDPVVRTHSATGLIDMSGSHYEYHADHSKEQKKRWFIEVAPKLVEYGFEHWVSFDRLLTKFDDYFPTLPIRYRTHLLKDIAAFVKTSPHYSSDTLYTIKKLTLECEPNEEELDILIDLIQSLSTWGKMGLSYDFALEFQNLPDQRFEDFVYRPFFNETPLEFMAERAAALLGFLSDESSSSDHLPITVQEFSDGQSVLEGIRKYVFAQNDQFKKIFILAAYKYKQVYHIGWKNLRNHSIVTDLIEYFSTSGTVEDAVLIADVIINSGYRQSNEPKFGENDEWFKLVKLFLYNQKSEICRRVCDIIFAANIASSIHSSRDFLMLVYLLLNHKDPEVEQYAFLMLDMNFHDVWERVRNPEHPESWQEEKKNTWFSREFLAKLQEKSQAFSNWMHSWKMLTYTENWDEIPPDLQIILIDYFSKIAKTEILEQVYLAKVFYDNIEEKISSEQRKQLKDAIYVEEASGRRDLRGRLKQLDRNWDLEKLHPKVDWNIYFS